MNREVRRRLTQEAIIRKLSIARLNIEVIRAFTGPLFHPYDCFLHAEDGYPWGGPPSSPFSYYDQISSEDWICLTPGHFRKAFPTGRRRRRKTGRGRHKGIPRLKKFDWRRRLTIHNERRLVQEFTRGIVTGRLDEYDSIKAR
jgi:hypothetical protein